MLLFRRADDRSQRSGVLTQQREDVLGLGGFGEGSKAAEVTEHNNDIAPVSFKDPLLAARNERNECQLRLAGGRCRHIQRDRLGSILAR